MLPVIRFLYLPTDPSLARSKLCNLWHVSSPGCLCFNFLIFALQTLTRYEYPTKIKAELFVIQDTNTSCTSGKIQFLTMACDCTDQTTNNQKEKNDKLLEASKVGDEQNVTKLVSEGAEINDLTKSCLLVSADGGHDKVVNFFLDQGVPVLLTGTNLIT